MDINDRANYFQEIHNAIGSFYEINKKKSVFTADQKTKCTRFVVEKLSLDKLIKCTVYIVPGTNILFYDYLVFKTYASDDNYGMIYEYVVLLIDEILKKYETYEFHMNLKSFTVSACHRYYSLISSSFEANEEKKKKLGKLLIYNTPSVVDQLKTILYRYIKDILPRTEFYYTESDDKIKQIMDLL